MRKIPEDYRHLPGAKRLEAARAEFTEAARMLWEANRSARAAGSMYSPEMAAAIESLNAAQRRMQQAEADFRQDIGGPDPVPLTEIVERKVRQLFPAAEQPEAIRLLETKCGETVPFNDGNKVLGLERVRLAVLKVAVGNMAELQRQIEAANRDWRDVINEAEYPEASNLEFVEYGNLNQEVRSKIEAQDRQQYIAWLNQVEDQQG